MMLVLQGAGAGLLPACFARQLYCKQSLRFRWTLTDVHIDGSFKCTS
jgi:hypothetical protein